MPNVYTSTVSLYVLMKVEIEGLNTLTSDLTSSQQLTNDIAQLAKSNTVIDATTEALGMDGLGDLEISVNSTSTNRIITLNVTGKKPEITTLVANQLAEDISDIAVDIMELDTVNIIDTAEVPTEPSGPNRPLYTIVAFLMGIVSAMAVALLSDILNTTVRNEQEFEDLFEIPVLASMPKIKREA